MQDVCWDEYLSSTSRWRQETIWIRWVSWSTCLITPASLWDWASLDQVNVSNPGFIFVSMRYSQSSCLRMGYGLWNHWDKTPPQDDEYTPDATSYGNTFRCDTLLWCGDSAWHLPRAYTPDKSINSHKHFILYLIIVLNVTVQWHIPCMWKLGNNRFWFWRCRSLQEQQQNVPFEFI